MSCNRFNRGGVVVAMLALIAGATVAAAPDAGEVIGNQAAATYSSGGQNFTVESNLVNTTVNAVYALDIASNETRTVAPGNFVYFPHVVTNTANTPDTVSLAGANDTGDNFNFSNIVIFADANKDGTPDSLTPITQTPAIAIGGDYGIVVRAQVPTSSVNNGDFATLTVTATSQGDGTVTDTVTDRANISTGGTISLNKTQTLANDADGDGVFSQGDTVQVVVQYENNGLSDALNVVIEDILPTTNQDGEAITLTYVNNATYTTEWSDVTGATLDDVSDGTDATNPQGNTLDYSFTGGTVRAAIDAVPASRVGTLTFHYVITDVQEGAIRNIATVTTTAQPTPESSNPSDVVIAATNEIVVADAVATAFGGANIGDEGATQLDSTTLDSTTDDGTDEDDIVTETSTVFVGQATRFNVIVTNLSDVTDTVALSVDNTAYAGGSAFPAGTSFQLVNGGTSTPVVGNTMTMAAGEARSVDVVVQFSSGASAVTGANFQATITATSTADPSVTNTAGLNFTGNLVEGTVDLTDETGAVTEAVGANVTNGGAPWEAGTTDPGAAFTFAAQITVPNGQPTNSFDLGAFGDAGFSTGLPSGWTVEFRDSSNNVITNTGALTPSGADAVFDFTVVVTPPAGAAASGVSPQDIYIRALSPINGVTDAVYYTLGVNEIVDLSLAADTDIQIAPGGVGTIAHTLTNNGNSTVTAGAISFGADDFTDTGMTAALYLDVNGDGNLDGGDTIIDDINDINGGAGLAAGASATIFVRVQSLAGQAPGTTETGVVQVATSVTTANGAATDGNTTNNDVNDSVEIISGDLTLVKRQGVDATCNGSLGDVGDTALTQGAITADPGQCIVYEIVATNTGTLDATSVIITDATPNFTTVETCAAACTAAAVINGVTPVSVTAPANGATGGLSTDAAGITLTGGDTLSLTFTVQIDQ